MAPLLLGATYVNRKIVVYLKGIEGGGRVRTYLGMLLMWGAIRTDLHHG